MPEINFGSPTVSGNIVVSSPATGLTAADVTTGSATTRTDTYTVPADTQWVLKRMAVSRANTGLNRCKLIIDSITYTFTDLVGATSDEWDLLDCTIKAGDSVVVEMQTGGLGALTSFVFYHEVSV